MKKRTLASIIFATALASSASQLMLTNTREGDMAKLAENPAREVDSLIVSGPMNSADLHVAWDGAMNGKLKYVNLAKAVFENNKLPDNAFFETGQKGFLNIDEIVLPENLEEIGAYAFRKTMITKMELPTTVKRLGEGTFYLCNRTYDYRDFRLPEGIEEIPDFCFYGAVQNTVFNFPKSLKSIGKSAFECCIILKIELPESLEETGSRSFAQTPLQEVVFKGGCKSLGSQMFSECPYLEKIVLPTDAEILPSAFLGETRITSLEIPDNFRIIDEVALGCNYYLKRVNFSEGIEEIGAHAFSLCDKMRAVLLPSTIKRLGDKALTEASTVLCKALTPPSCEGKISNYNIRLYVPVGTKNLYAKAEGWKDQADEIIELTDQEFETAEITEITESTDAVKITTEDSCAIIEAEGNTPINFEIYSTDGKLIIKGTAAPRAKVEIASGVHIIKTGKSIRKIVI